LTSGVTHNKHRALEMLLLFWNHSADLNSYCQQAYMN
jgi:hypothetical protein